MKKILLIILLGFFSIQSYAQDPIYFQTWYLIYAEADLGDPYLIVEDVEPPISPYLTIYENLDFEGFGACNFFSGYFIYEDDPSYGDTFTPFDFSQTIDDCEFEEHSNFDDEYFTYFQNENISLTAITYENPDTEIVYLELQSGPGFIYHYQNTPILSSNDIFLEETKIYPNPVSNNLFISSKNKTIENITLYTLTGRKLKEFAIEVNSIDVSTLSKGLYFIEISSASGKSVKKFIKK